jgi:hypothetical protein
MVDYQRTWLGFGGSMRSHTAACACRCLAAVSCALRSNVHQLCERQRFGVQLVIGLDLSGDDVDAKEKR